MASSFFTGIAASLCISPYLGWKESEHYTRGGMWVKDLPHPYLHKCQEYAKSGKVTFWIETVRILTLRGIVQKVSLAFFGLEKA